MKHISLITVGLFGLLSAAAGARAADSGASVVVIYNSRVPESKQVAEHYAQRRSVPAGQVFGYELPAGELVSRAVYLDKLQRPLLKDLEAAKLVTFGTVTNTNGATFRVVVDAKIRYAALCFGVPTRIEADASLVETNAGNLPPELKRNGASVDSQLATLPMAYLNPMWTGPLNNPVFTATNGASIQLTNGLLMVTRLDGPTAIIAKGLVDKALEAETNGLWGRTFFDARGFTNGSYQVGDDWMRAGAAVCQRMGLETVIDEKPETFSAGVPLPQIGLYAGWYDWHASGPFARTDVEFMPGAIAYHLHSFSAQTIRSTSDNWVGPLLARGAAATLGNVDEPYLGATPDLGVFFSRLVMLGFSFGEAAWAAQNMISWQGLAVGDPLYRPFGKRPDTLHLELIERKSPLAEWSHLRVVNLNLATGAHKDQAISYLEQLSLTKSSSLLKEKLADLYWERNRFSDALATYEEALALKTTPQQKLGLLLRLADRRTNYGGDSKPYAVYERVLKEFPDYPDPLGVYRKMLPLARSMEKKEEIERCEREIKRLTPAEPKK